MGSRLGRRVLHFANLPIKLMLPPAPLSSVQEFAVKTIPSASKVDIRRCLESMYGFSIAEVRTLNMEGKKLRRGPFLAAKPDYKKAYVTLRAPLSVSPDIFPIGVILGERERKASAAAARRKAVEGAEVEGERDGKGKHWMEVCLLLHSLPVGLPLRIVHGGPRPPSAASPALLTAPS